MGKPIWPELPDAEHERFLSDLYGSLCQHFVCLAVRLEALDDAGTPTDETKQYFISGFVIIINETWCLITAGHIVKDLGAKLASKEYGLFNSFLIYHLGHHVTNGKLMQFDYGSAPTYFIDASDLGLDYAVIVLSDMDTLKLRENNIIPVSMDYWTSVQFSSYWMLGLPIEVSDSLNQARASDERDRRLGAVILSVAAITDESQVPFMFLRHNPKFTSFFGEITADIAFGINGMSGGPIFGVVVDPNGILRYTVVAIQNAAISGPTEPSKTSIKIAGCPMSIVADHIRNILKL